MKRIGTVSVKNGPYKIRVWRGDDRIVTLCYGNKHIRLSPDNAERLKNLLEEADASR